MYLVMFLIKGLSGHRFRFLPNGDPPAKYRILNFRQPTAGNYEWVTVGTYDQKKLSVSFLFVNISISSDVDLFISCLISSQGHVFCPLFYSWKARIHTWVLSLSGDFTPCRHLRPSSGREHTVVDLQHIQSGDDDYLMNGTRRKPTTGTRCPTLFDKWHANSPILKY